MESEGCEAREIGSGRSEGWRAAANGGGCGGSGSVFVFLRV